MRKNSDGDSLPGAPHPFRTPLLKVWSRAQQHKHPQGTGERCKTWPHPDLRCARFCMHIQVEEARLWVVQVPTSAHWES